MDKPSQADLIGYILGALDNSEKEQIDSLIENESKIGNSEIHAQIEKLESRLACLDSSVEEVKIPTGLARRTIEAIALLDPDVSQVASPRMTAVDRVIQEHAESLAAEEKVEPAPASMGEGDLRAQRSSSWSVMDIVVASAACMLLGVLGVHWISNSQYNSRIASCQDNLRTIGVSLASYANDHNGKLIPISLGQNDGVAGIYASKLREMEYIQDEKTFFCPSAKRDDSEVFIPTQDDLLAASGVELRELQHKVGGDYAYTIGCMNGDEYLQPQLYNPSYQVILADTPDSNSIVSESHGGRAQNVLMGDFSIRKTINCTVNQRDHIYRNDVGLIAPGTSLTDSVLGSSGTAPYVSISRTALQF